MTSDSPLDRRWNRVLAEDFFGHRYGRFLSEMEDLVPYWVPEMLMDLSAVRDEIRQDQERSSELERKRHGNLGR